MVLTEREASTLLMAFGLLDGRPCHLNTMSCVFGVSRERVRQYARTGLAKLDLADLRLPVFPRGWDEDPQRETSVYDIEYAAMLIRRAFALEQDGEPVELDAIPDPR
ncbi:hypothetical protein [Actinokineospora cianjurensis]|uniref:hypothetical protein n=1 Tax=Actinokineospora cianjurensis TaxID=585224 RepID=UPI0011C4791C|nr:hypothetical protein [Actinokineospora cianjurensis]